MPLTQKALQQERVLDVVDVRGPLAEKAKELDKLALKFMELREKAKQCAAKQAALRADILELLPSLGMQGDKSLTFDGESTRVRLTSRETVTLNVDKVIAMCKRHKIPEEEYTTPVVDEKKLRELWSKGALPPEDLEEVFDTKLGESFHVDSK